MDEFTVVLAILPDHSGLRNWGHSLTSLLTIRTFAVADSGNNPEDS